MSTMNITEQAKSSLDIAVVGMAGRFPGAHNLQEFWENLKEGKESIKFFSQTEVVNSGVHPEMARNPDFVPAAGALDGEYMFDAEFFDLTPREAEIMDPQHRMLLECSWEAIESAGYSAESYPGKIGIFAGTSINVYFLFHIVPNRKMLESIGLLPAIAANDKDYLATRVAYKLNLRGPALTVQTACSTSLVAVSLACQSLLSYQSDMVLAGGVSITPKGRLYQEGSIFSKDGHCRPFDIHADGTVGGNGVGVVVLKRLEDALADHDTIHAIIKGSAINNDGSLKVGFSAPSVNGQVDVILTAQAVAGVNPETITYVEAHGTGTALGDPIEIEALTQAFRTRTKEKGYCAISAVKSNIGHLDAASGIAGFIKAVLALENGQIPPTAHLQTVNPQLRLEDSPFFINSELRSWETRGMPRRAAVSSFGWGGTNVHAILEEAPVAESSRGREWQILPLSARNDVSLQDAFRNLTRYCKTQTQSDISLADIAFTLQAGRTHFKQRAFAVARSVSDAAAIFESLDPRRLKTSTAAQGNCSVAFMFPGQGSQFVNMARDLYQEEPVFRQAAEQCAHLMQPHLKRDLLEIIYPGPHQEAANEALLTQTQFTQPSIFLIEYALAMLWRSWGVLPQSMIGHSIGEYVAACLAGVFSLEDGVRLVCARARLIQQQPAGAMLMVPVSEDHLSKLIPADLSLAAVNAPERCVVSGPLHAIETFRSFLSRCGVSGHLLPVSHAFHSQMMEEAAADFEGLFAGINLSPPRLRFVSNVTGDWITDEQACSPVYWAQHLRSTVRFSEGLMRLLETKPTALLEVGPGQALTSLAAQQRELVKDCALLASSRHSQVAESDLAQILGSIGTLWARGVNINWHQLHSEETCRRVPLPTYPFQRQLYWLPPVEGEPDHAAPRAAADPEEPTLRRNDESSGEHHASGDELEAVIIAVWKNVLGLQQIGMQDEFFALGGHSLLAVQLVAELRRATNTEISIAALFQEPTVAGLAKKIRDLSASSANARQGIVPIPRDRHLPLTFHQETVWDFERAMPGTARYNGLVCLSLKGALNQDALHVALDAIVRRHEVLRTTYITNAQGLPQAVIHPPLHLDLPVTDLSHLPADIRNRELSRSANELVRRPFDLREDLVIRPVLFNLLPNEHMLMISSHYIALDARAIGLFLREIAEHYCACVESRPSRSDELRFQCVDYAHWQRSRITSAAVDPHLPYWRKQLCDLPPQQPLLPDRARTPRFDMRGATFHFMLEPALTRATREFCSKHGFTLFITLISALNILFRSCSGAADIAIAVAIANHEVGMEPLFGAFVDYLVLRNRVDSSQTFLQLMENVQRSTNEAYAHQIPFCKVADALREQRDLASNPLFRAMLILRDIPLTKMEAAGLDIELSVLPVDRAVSEVDVSLYIQDHDGTLDGYFEYDPRLFDSESIRQLSDRLSRVLHHIVSNRHSGISCLEREVGTAAA